MILIAQQLLFGHSCVRRSVARCRSRRYPSTLRLDEKGIDGIKAAKFGNDEHGVVKPSTPNAPPHLDWDKGNVVAVRIVEASCSSVSTAVVLPCGCHASTSATS